MSTHHARSVLSMTYTGEDGETITPPTQTVSSPYPEGGAVVGGVPLPDGAGRFHSIPFGDITNATKVRVENTSGQAMDIGFNGSGCLFTMPPGSYFEFGSPVRSADGTWLQSIEGVLADSPEGDNSISSKVFGYADD